MKIKEIRQVPGADLSALMGRIPFFKELGQRDPAQLQVLLGYSCLVELEAGETIMRRGQKGTWLYFLIKGELEVYRDEPVAAQRVGAITPGELFGDLALLCGHERKATVAAAPRRGALLFACDFAPFDPLEYFSTIHLSTKILFYRTVLHSVRWRLEVSRREHPDQELIKELMRVPVFTGAKDGVEELRALQRQAQSLADILERWNRVEAPLNQLFVTAPMPSRSQ